MTFCGLDSHIWTYIFMIYNLIQCILHIVISSVELLIYNSNPILDLTQKEQLLLYLTYFANGYNDASNIKLKNAASLTKNLAISYSVLDALWVFFTIIILLMLCFKRRDKLAFTMYIIWDVISGFELLLNISGMIVYLVNITQTQDINGLEDFLEFPISNEFKDITSLPSVIMLIIESRFCVFLLLNIITFIAMIIITVKLKKNFKQPNQRIVPLKPPKPVIKNPKATHLEEQNIPRVNDWYKHYEAEDNGNVVPDLVPSFIPRLGDKRSSSPTSYLSSDSYTNSHSNILLNNQTNVMVNGVPSGTLRRQLPWSYFHQPGDQVKKQARRWNVEPPPVPVPDYSMRLPRNQKLQLEDREWDQYPPINPKPKTQQYY